MTTQELEQLIEGQAESPNLDLNKIVFGTQKKWLKILLPCLT
jgi:hypothetical protein